MVSKNFEPLAKAWPDIYKQAIEAESFMHRDPNITMLKLRCFGELLVNEIYKILKFSASGAETFFDKLNNESFIKIVDRKILHKLHTIRLEGNKAAHGKSVRKDSASLLCYEAYLIGQWFYKMYGDNSFNPYPEYVELNNLAEKIELANLESELLEAKKRLSQIQSESLLRESQNLALTKKLDGYTIERIKERSDQVVASINLDKNDLSNLLNLEDVFTEYDLTDDQKKLVEHLAEFLNNKNLQVFLLNGYAGTGKTFITKGLTEYLDIIGRQYHLAAPTGKAAQVISQKTQRVATTIHRMIYSINQLQEFSEDVENSETYKIYATLKANADSANAIYIIDEASMISNISQEEEFFRFGTGYLLNDLINYINLDHNDHNKKIIFIGDNAQLPPIGMKFSPALQDEYLKTHFGLACSIFELKEVVRQKSESGILKNSVSLRKSLENNVFNQINLDFNTKDIDEVFFDNILDVYLQACNYKVNDQVMIIAASNADVLTYNKLVRSHFFPNRDTIMPGDKVISISNINHSSFGFFIANGMFGFVRAVDPNIEKRVVILKNKNKETGKINAVEVPLIFRNVELGFRDPDGKAIFASVKIIDSLLYSDSRALSSDESKALYVDFMIRNPSIQGNKELIKDALQSDPYYNALRIKFGYAITCHKAQGSEWNNVIVKCSTYQNQLSEQYFRWLYTAVTRSSKHLYLLDPPKVKLGGNLQSVRSPNLNFNPVIIQPSVGLENEKLIDLEQETFGIPNNAHFSLALLKKVRQLTQGITLQGVTLNQYHDVYFFQKDDNFAKLSFYYNSKEKITNITSGNSELDYSIKELVLPLVNILITPITATNDEVHFGEEFHKDFHDQLSRVALRYGVSIIKVEQMDWKLRYTFEHKNQYFSYDIFYNGKKQFTKINLVGKNQMSESIQLVEYILTKGMNE